MRGDSRRCRPRALADSPTGSAQTEEGDMAIESLIILLIVGAIAGWLAGVIMKGYGFGLIGNIVVGIVGAFLASLILPMLGISIGGGILGAIIHATIGAVILLFLIGLVKR
jgi:uncharacterized membrane protein YeaQ/YmgE (transglycosylase-associated protein family)